LYIFFISPAQKYEKRTKFILLIVSIFLVFDVKFFIFYGIISSGFLYFYRFFCNVGFYNTCVNVSTVKEEKK